MLYLKRYDFLSKLTKFKSDKFFFEPIIIFLDVGLKSKNNPE